MSLNKTSSPRYLFKKISIVHTQKPLDISLLEYFYDGVRGTFGVKTNKNL